MFLVLAGCGTTRTTDSARTATEQLLISDAIDRAVQTVNLRPLTGHSVYLDGSHLGDVVDRNYLVSTLRQHLLASGCVLKDERDEAEFIVEARAGAVGTDRSDLLFGIPATNVPQILPFQSMPAAIPEVPLAKRRDQRGIAKISMFAYHRESGLPVWQSGLAVRESSSNDVWIFGAGPFQHGTINQGPTYAAKRRGKEATSSKDQLAQQPSVDLEHEATFTSPARLVQQFHRLPPATEVVQASPASHPADGDGSAGPVPPSQQESATAGASSVAGPSEPASFRRDDGTVPPLLPGLSSDATRKDEPQLSARIYEWEQLRRPTTKTAEVVPRDVGSVPLPVPRYDSL